MTETTTRFVRAVSPPVPDPRGPLSSWVLDALQRPPHELDPAAVPAPQGDPLTGEDLPLALYCCYELHYRGLDGVDEGWEWHPGLLSVRATMEERFLAALHDAVGEVEAPDDIVTHLQSALAGDDGRSVGAWCEERGELAHLREQAVLRTPWQLKEADPHSWALPRLHGRPKAALVEIQMDEYGNGVEKDIHAQLYALTLERLGVDPAYGADLHRIPGVALSTVNLVSLFGLHRRWLGALVGHLAVFEMTSVQVMARYSAALRRLGFDEWTRLFYDTHVVADSHHQTVAATELAAGLVAQEPDLSADIAFGAAALGRLEALLTDHVLDAWEAGRSALLAPLPPIDRAPGQEARPIPAQDPRTEPA